MSKRKMIITAIVTIVLAVSSAVLGVHYSERDVTEISNSVETVVNTVDNIVDNQREQNKKKNNWKCKKLKTSLLNFKERLHMMEIKQTAGI